jgi:hypothetical protein
MQIVPQLVERCPVLYETGRFIFAIERAVMGFCPKSVESTYYYLVSGLCNPACNAVSSKLYRAVEPNPQTRTPLTLNTLRTGDADLRF